MNKTYSLPIELKALGEDGKFSGYAATYDLDLGDDVITKQALEGWLNGGSADKKMTVLWQHEMDKPIGVTTKMMVDERGLYVEGQLTLGVRLADEARLLSKAGALKGMSIGFRVRDREYREDGVRVIKEIDIIEYSFVTLPMNPKAVINGVKSTDQPLVEILLKCDTIRALERTLRDEVGASNSEAKRFISHIKTLCDAEREQAKTLASIEATLKSMLEGRK